MIGERASSLAPATWVGAVTGEEIFPYNASNMVLGHVGEGCTPASPTEVNQFSSRHTGGAQFVFADGHVEYLTGSVSFTVYGSARHPSGWRSYLRRLLMRSTFTLLMALLMTIGCGSAKKKEAIPIEQVPEKVMMVAKEKLPDVTFDRAIRKPNGEYEVIGKNKQGKVREIDITPNGEVTEIE